MADMAAGASKEIKVSKEPKEPKEIKQKITMKELKAQRVLIIGSILFVIYGFIFYYLPLGGWIMAFQNYKAKTGLLHSPFVYN